MCGICGILKLKNNDIDVAQLLSSMQDITVHRGPDEQAKWSDDDYCCGINRLSVVGLLNGKQPIMNEEKNLLLVVNGEIYNYKILQDELRKNGHNFTTDSDVEVLLHGYEEYGIDFLQKVEGMFVFAIYDLRKKELIIARDFFGEKPLHYAINNNTFLFASELKSILATNLCPKSIDNIALNQYFSLSYIPAPRTIFESVKKLLPGNYLIINKQGNIEVKEYANLSKHSASNDYNYESSKDAIRDLMYKSVEQCLKADVEVGVLLSGGIDSAIITAIASKVVDKKIKTFTLAYDEKQYDESQQAVISARYNNTEHYELKVDNSMIISCLDEVLSNIDEPFSDSSYLPTYMISKFARKHVKVVLGGDGGDEFFGGYNKYLIDYYSNIYNKIPRWLQENLINKSIKKLTRISPKLQAINKIINNSRLPLVEQRINMMFMAFRQKDLKKLLVNYNDESWNDIKSSYFEFHNQGYDEVNSTLLNDIKYVLEGDMLTKSDRASMLASLEIRNPILNRKLFDFIKKMPSNYKLDKKQKKKIWRETFQDLIHPQILKYPKHGFEMPINDWLRNIEDDLRTTLEKDKIEQQGIFNYVEIDRFLNEHIIEKQNHGRQLWALYIFQKWFDKYAL